MGCGPLVIARPAPTKMVEEPVLHRAGSQAQGEGPAVLLSICKGRGSLETALTSQSGLVAF